mmetsp:Transcript_7541/g.17952  ORF Transcript_7541/g.17952 Transcript_7541/m.17952 type:complete len:237 (+) Transcript_7541:206-916(+)
MLGLVVPNGREGIVQGVHFGPPYLARSGLEFIEHVQVAIAVVIHRDLRSRLGLELLLVLLDELIVCQEGMFFDILIEIVGHGGIPKVQAQGQQVVAHTNVLCDESIEPPFSSAKLFHYHQVVHFVPIFGKMDLEILGLAPHANSFVEVQRGRVAEVGDAGDGLEGVEAGIVPPSEQRVEDGPLEESDGDLVEFLGFVRQRFAEAAGGIVEPIAFGSITAGCRVDPGTDHSKRRGGR